MFVFYIPMFVAVLVIYIFNNDSSKSSVLLTASLTAMLTALCGYFAWERQERKRQNSAQYIMLASLKAELQAIQKVIESNASEYKKNRHIHAGKAAGWPAPINITTVFENVSENLGLLNNQILANNIVNLYINIKCILTSISYHKTKVDSDWILSCQVQLQNTSVDRSSFRLASLKDSDAYICHIYNEVFEKKTQPLIEAVIAEIDRELENFK